MRYLPIKKVEAGMVLAQDILDGQGVMLLGRHQILNQEQIENLDKMGYPGLYIDDKFSEEIEIAIDAVAYPFQYFIGESELFHFGKRTAYQMIADKARAVCSREKRKYFLQSAREI